MKNLQLSNGPVAIVDDDVFEIVRHYRWTREKNGAICTYIRGKGGWETLKLHHLIMGAVKGDTVPYKNGDWLDNRRSNLVLIKPRQKACPPPSGSQSPEISRDEESLTAGACPAISSCHGTAEAGPLEVAFLVEGLIEKLKEMQAASPTYEVLTVPEQSLKALKAKCQAMKFRISFLADRGIHFVRPAPRRGRRPRNKTVKEAS